MNSRGSEGAPTGARQAHAGNEKGGLLKKSKLVMMNFQATGRLFMIFYFLSSPCDGSREDAFLTTLF